MRLQHNAREISRMLLHACVQACVNGFPIQRPVEFKIQSREVKCLFAYSLISATVVSSMIQDGVKLEMQRIFVPTSLRQVMKENSCIIVFWSHKLVFYRHPQLLWRQYSMNVYVCNIRAREYKRFLSKSRSSTYNDTTSYALAC